MMRYLIQGLIVIVCAFIQPVAYSSVEQNVWYERHEEQVILNVELYLSTSCPHCLKAEKFFEQAQKQYDWLHVKKYFINESKVALKQFSNRLSAIKSINYNVPSIFFCDSRWVGFKNGEDSGAALLKSLDYCHQQIMTHGSLNEATIQALKAQGDISQYSPLNHVQNERGYFSATVGMLDALNQCTLFVFMALLGFILIKFTYLKEQFFVGLVCISAIMLLKITQIISTHSYYIIDLNTRWLSILAAFMLLLLIFQNIKKLNSNQTKNAILIPLAFITTALVQIKQQTCALNYTLIYKQWLQGLHLHPAQSIGYTLLYLIFMLATMLISLGFLLFIFNLKKFTKHQVYWSIFGWINLLIVAAILLINPGLFGQSMTSVMMMLFSAFVSRIFVSVKRKNEAK